MKRLRRLISPASAMSAPTPDPLSGEEALRIALSAKAADDWVTALLALERANSKTEDPDHFRKLHHWALGRAGRKVQSNPWTKLKVLGAPLGLLPGPAMALAQLVFEVKPRTILEIGSCGGGTALWLHVYCRGLGLITTIHSADWGVATKSGDVQFWSGDLRKPSGIWPGALLKNMEGPSLLLVRTMGGHEVTWPAVRSMHKWMRKDDVLCVVNEPDADPALPPEAKKSSVHALLRFAARHPVEYRVLPDFDKQFGPDGIACGVIAFQHTGISPLDPNAAPGLSDALSLMEKGDWKAALDDLNLRKAARKPERGVDYLRAVCFLEQGAVHGACEAAKEELRFFPDHIQADTMRASLFRQLFPGKPKIGGREFHQLYSAVRPYTMLSEERLYSLYLRTRLVCQMDIPGDLVECGVAAGGGSALIAATMMKHTRRPRKLYSCDTFEGMPVPGENDVAYGVEAEASGWGSGTCAAPPGSLLEICAKLRVDHVVVPVQGFFKDTLPGLRDRLPEGIAFLHMDGDWYESTMDILVNLYERVQPQGFIQVDDFGHWEGCRKAMAEYGKMRGVEFTVHIIDATGVWLQRPDRGSSDLMLLNLGCGSHYHNAWTNLDISPVGKEVIQHDLSHEPLPFEDGSCAVVYHSHVLEHIPPTAVPNFLQECCRVLVEGGVIRLAVPDLEGIAREYLAQLDAGDQAKHEWMIYELVDQLARHRSGGRMMAYWQQSPMPAEEFVLKRMGREASDFVQKSRAQSPASDQPPIDETPEAVGAFRLSGEVHRWMYDRLSLASLLEAAGFRNVRVCTAIESSIPDFQRYGLDADSDGNVRKPDSLFMEAVKHSSCG